MIKVLIVSRGSLSTQTYVPSRSIFCRVLEPFYYLRDNRTAITFDTLKTEEITSDNIRSYDVVVFCKHNTADSIRVARLADQFKIKTIYDIDDLIHRFTKDSAAYVHMDNVNYLKEHLEMADVVVASTETLKNVIVDDFNLQKITVIRTGINVDKYHKKNYRPEKSNIIFTNGDNIKINSFRQAFTQMFNHFLTQRPAVEFEIFGDSESYVKDFSRYRFLGSLPWDQHKQWLSTHQVEFAIIPLGSEEESAEHQLFSDCKTPIKYLEYGAMRIPGVYSNAPIYREVIKHQETGLLVDNSSESWRTALERIHSDTELRNNIAENAFEDVNQHHHIKIAAEKWLDIF